MFIRFKLGKIATGIILLTLFMGAYTYIPGFQNFIQSGINGLIEGSETLKALRSLIY